ncbi:MAG: hypothetical protein GY722_19535 [bacterium]|nr:hypothetical protein [bacterium]
MNVISVDPADFFGELHGFEWASGEASDPRRAPTPAGSNGDLARKVRQVEATLGALVGLLLEKRIISGRDLRASVQESSESSGGQRARPGALDPEGPRSDDPARIGAVAD